MHKVGIITFQESRNFGALLQAYALRLTLLNLGYQANIINYHSKGKEGQYSSRFSSKRSLLVNINLLLSFGISKKNKKICDKFKTQYLKLDERLLTREELDSLNSQYDAFVCGSDQIWNPNSIKHDGTFFLDFVREKSKRVAYAPSVGVTDICENDMEFFVNGVKGFEFLSVREKSASELINRLIDREPLTVLDPTLLIDKDEWMKLTGDRIHKRKYIFLYMVGYTPKAVQLAKRIAKNMGCDVVVPAKTIRDYKDGFKYFIGGPLEFLNMIKNAELVITTSFHGMMFSINFEKPFCVVDKPESKRETASRIDDFLHMVDIQDRKYNGNDDVFIRTMDYQKINKKIEILRKESLQYLSDSLYNACNLN